MVNTNMFGTNWTANYYNNINLSGTPVYSEFLPNGININWGTGAPSYAVQPDNFSARFTSVQTFEGAVYEFAASSESGIRVYIDDALILDRFIVRPLMTDRFRLRMEAGEHSLKIEYFAAVGLAAVQFQWFVTDLVEEVLRFTQELTSEEHAKLMKQLREAPEPVLFGEYRVSSLEEMLQQIFPKPANIGDSSVMPFFWLDAPYYYRGQAENNEEWGLIPTIFRGIKKTVPDKEQKDYVAKICKWEKYIYDDFADRSRGYLPAWVERKNSWEMISIAQHFGVPTRLLDWTSNCLAATYFAVCEKFDKDGVVWCLRGRQFQFREEHPDRNQEHFRYMRFASLPTATSFFSNLGDEQKRDNTNSEQEPYFALILPPNLDNRMKNQGGIFSVYVTFKEPETLDELVYDHAEHITKTAPTLLSQFIIKADAKAEIKAQLEDMGIDFSQLFPDLYGLGRYLAEWRRQKFNLDSK